jgi:16S rRNA (adenine1518-N6/adenine1519-N6)-dimethyltransferase
MSIFEQTKNLCKLYNIQPTRSKGQNFLINEEVYDKIVESAELNSDDLVLEVGPGLGFLTAKLAKKAKKVVAVELDDKLANLLKIAIWKW